MLPREACSPTRFIPVTCPQLHLQDMPVTAAATGCCLGTLHSCRSFSLSANITTVGDKEAVVKLNKPDSNSGNDKDATTTKAFITCAEPHGQLGQRPPCQEGRYYTGFDRTRLAKAEDFQDTCCVRG